MKAKKLKIKCSGSKLILISTTNDDFIQQHINSLLLQGFFYILALDVIFKEQ